MESRVCVRCQVYKPASAFPSQNGHIHGARCLACLAELRRIERAGRPPKPKRQTERDLTEKRCNVCGIVKPVSDFYWNQRKWSSECRPCRIEKVRQRRAADLNRAKEQERATHARRAPRRNAEQRAHYAQHREQVLARQRSVYYPRHAAKARETNRRWRLANPARSLELVIRRRARIAGSPTVEVIDRAAIIARDGSVCYLCGIKVSGWWLTLDHMTPLSRGGAHTADNLRVACRPCNSRKRHLTLAEYLARLEATGCPVLQNL